MTGVQFGDMQYGCGAILEICFIDGSVCVFDMCCLDGWVSENAFLDNALFFEGGVFINML